MTRRRLGWPWLLQGCAMALALGLLIAPASGVPADGTTTIRPATPAEAHQAEVDRLHEFMRQQAP